MLKIHDLRISSNEAIGTVFSDQLNDKQLKKLNVTIEDKNGFCREIPVNVLYSVQWSDNLAMVTIESVYLFNDEDPSIELELNDKEYDYDQLSLDLESNGPYLEWLEDKDNYLEDRYYFEYKENQ